MSDLSHDSKGETPKVQGDPQKPHFGRGSPDSSVVSRFDSFRPFQAFGRPWALLGVSRGGPGRPQRVHKVS